MESNDSQLSSLSRGITQLIHTVCCFKSRRCGASYFFKTYIPGTCGLANEVVGMDDLLETRSECGHCENY